MLLSRLPLMLLVSLFFFFFCLMADFTLKTQYQTQVKSLGSCTAKVKSHIIRTSFIKNINQQTSAFIIKKQIFSKFQSQEEPCARDQRCGSQSLSAGGMQSDVYTSPPRFHSTPSLPASFSLSALLLSCALFTLIPSSSEKENVFCCELASLARLRRLLKHH